jgi:formylglycine-generating enzyme required for sulfatase activity
MRACNGASARPYPYGGSYQASRCNDTKQWKPPKWEKLARYPNDTATAEADRLYQADPSGTRESCVSEDGVFDLTGNVAEWVRRTYPTQKNYSHVIKGCFWSGCFHTREVSCAFKNPAHPGDFRSYEVGFRCCSEVGEVDGGR